MIEALKTYEGRTSRPRSANEINQIVRGRERPYEAWRSNGTLHQMVSGDLLVADGMTREYGASNGVATVQVKVPSQSSGAGPPVAPAERPEVNDGSQKPRGVLDEIEGTWGWTVVAAVATVLSVLAIFIVSQRHERASEIVTWPVTSAIEQDVRITGDYTVEVRYSYVLNEKNLRIGGAWGHTKRRGLPSLSRRGSDRESVVVALG